jgi:phytoene desaturase
MLTLRDAAASGHPSGGPGERPARGGASGTGPAGRPRAVVIGAGFGGLAAAARLGARGFDVTLVERLDAPGGRAYVFRQDGFSFDAGPTIVTAPTVFEHLWAACGRDFHADVTLKKLDPFYRIRFDDGETIDCTGDRAKMYAEVERVAPGDLAGYRRFEGDSRRIHDYAFSIKAHEPFHRLIDTVKMAPRLIWMGGHWSVHRYVSNRVKSDKLRFALSFHPLFVGGDPFATTSFYCLINHLEQGWGVNYAMGGTGALVRAMADLVGHVGGRIRYGAEVEAIERRGDRATGVRLKGGEVLPAEVVVCNADPATVYRTMLPGRPRRRWTDAKLDRMDYSMSVVVWYFGANRRWDEVPHHAIVLGPRYKPLIKDIFRRKIVADDFSMYLHRPSASDPSVAPEGCDAFYALVPVPNLDGGQDWEAMAAPFRERILKRLEETMLPGLRQHIVTERMIDPRYFRDVLGSERGAAFGMEPQLLQSAWFRPHNKSEELEGLYFVGAGTHPGAGLPGVVSSARVVDGLVPPAHVVAAQAVG